jgi:GNAT superfamily N-acetyltransferase
LKTVKAILYCQQKTTDNKESQVKDLINVSFKVADTPQKFAEGANLFQQYAAFIGIDLSFQNFAEELHTIDQQYQKPDGCLLIAYDDTKPIACVALRKWDDETAELKRMFVQPTYQGQKIGYRLMKEIIAIAKELHYRKIKLDTLSTMESALKLYRVNGFYEIPPYRFNPIENTVYMEKNLQ